MGGGVMRVVGRAVGGASLGGAQEAFAFTRPRAASLPTLAPPSSSSSSLSMPVPATATPNSPLHSTDGGEWEAIEKDYGVTDSAHRFVFGPAPSKDEVEVAVSAIQRVFAPVTHSQNSSAEQQSDWIEAAGHVYTMNESLSQGLNNVLDAFRLLQTNPSVQRMVVSLSSDTAVWDAIMSNEAVQELRESFPAAKQGGSPNYTSGSLPGAANHLQWILDNMRAMILELIDRITALVDHLFRPPHKENPMNVFNDTVRSSFMLSIMVLLVVVMTRVQNA